MHEIVRSLVVVVVVVVVVATATGARFGSMNPDIPVKEVNTNETRNSGGNFLSPLLSADPLWADPVAEVRRQLLDSAT
jgi:hypothetical protein